MSQWALSCTKDSDWMKKHSGRQSKQQETTLVYTGDPLSHSPIRSLFTSGDIKARRFDSMDRIHGMG